MTEPQPGYYALTVWFGGTGYDPRKSYADCVTGSTSWCGGLYGVVDQAGNLSFDIGTVQPGDYTVQVFEQTRKGLLAVSSPVAFTLITP
jgi:hypothetical protein